ncbi:VCBS domain-containing protein, partial [Methylocaldum sp.]|uniref:VCBS domain-containing protein n=1 Tax=Methylocaldum sp. TaxID=1969727 RepID=UPI002D6503C4
NDAAVITGTSTGALTETDAVQSVGGTLAATDVDSSAAFVAQTNVAGSNGYGKFTINAAGVWTYVMDTAHNEFAQGQPYTDSITVATADGTTQVITVTITGSNDGPVAVADIDSLSLASDISTAGNVLANDTDVDTGDIRTVSAVNGIDADVGTSVAGSYGTITINSDGSYVYNIDPLNPAVIALGASGTLTETFSYTVSDSHGATSTTTLTVTINGNNQVPTVTADTGNVQEDLAVTASGNVLANDSDVNNDTLTVSRVNGIAGNVGNTVNGTYGSVAIAADGSYTYTLNNAAVNVQALAAGQTVTDTFTYTADDGNGGTTSSTLTITITGSNDTPVITSTAQAGSVAEDGTQTATGQVTASDVDLGAILTYTGNNTGVYGAITVNSSTGAWEYTLNNAAAQSLAGGQTVTENYTITVTDEHGASVQQVVAISITGTNDAAVITGTSTGALTETDAVQSVGGTLAATDVDSSAAFVAQTNVAGS